MPEKERKNSEAKFLVPDWGIQLTLSGIGLSYRPASLCSLVGRCTTTLSHSRLYPPQSGTKNSELVTQPPPLPLPGTHGNVCTKPV
jgi:hypothetical protein